MTRSSTPNLNPMAKILNPRAKTLNPMAKTLNPRAKTLSPKAIQKAILEIAKKLFFLEGGAF